MQKKIFMLCLRMALILGILFGACSGLAEDEIHLYQGIPMDGATPKIVSQILFKNQNVSFTISKEVWSGTADGIKDFGYEWNLQLDFVKDDKDVSRILLSSVQKARVAPDEFDARVKYDLLEFIDVENQLTKMYGDPDCRFFFTTDAQGKASRYMFQSGTWDIEQMLAVFKQKRMFIPYSVWGNVVLKAWISEQNKDIGGNSLTRIMLYYYPDMNITASLIASPIALFLQNEDH